ncbi:hypothetical protein [Aquipuribacter sp. MA13-6]|uniref:hypothetical protein n=1 Tax=unclassified Aquipuribacter TaxID=2635084 RepID=UPI003EF0057D
MTARGPERLAWLLDLLRRQDGPDLDPGRVDLAGVRAVWDWLPTWAATGRPGIDLTPPDGRDPRDGLPPWTQGSPSYQQYLLDRPNGHKNQLVLDGCLHLVAAALATVDPTFRWAVFFHAPELARSAFGPAMVSDSNAWISTFNLTSNFFGKALDATNPPKNRDITSYLMSKLREQGYQVDDTGHLLPGTTPPAPIPGQAPVDVTLHRREPERPGDVEAEIVVWPSRTATGLLHVDDIDDTHEEEMENPTPERHLDRTAVEAFLTAIHLHHHPGSSSPEEEQWYGPGPLPSPLSATLDLHPDGTIAELTIIANGITDATLEHVHLQLLHLLEHTPAAAFIPR